MCVQCEGVLCVYQVKVHQVKVYYVYQVEEYYVCTRGRRVYIPVLVKGFDRVCKRRRKLGKCPCAQEKDL